MSALDYPSVLSSWTVDESVLDTSKKPEAADETITRSGAAEVVR